MAATVMCDNSETALREEQHLDIPGVGIQRPAVRECHDRAFAPILIIDLSTIFRCNCAHMFLLSVFLIDVVHKRKRVREVKVT